MVPEARAFVFCSAEPENSDSKRRTFGLVTLGTSYAADSVGRQTIADPAQQR
jgi:hypothetical protein